jgi:hypothetical protein
LSLGMVRTALSMVESLSRAVVMALQCYNQSGSAASQNWQSFQTDVQRCQAVSFLRSAVVELYWADNLLISAEGTQVNEDARLERDVKSC